MSSSRVNADGTVEFFGTQYDPSWGPDGSTSPVGARKTPTADMSTAQQRSMLASTFVKLLGKPATLVTSDVGRRLVEAQKAPTVEASGPPWLAIGGGAAAALLLAYLIARS